MTFRFEDFNAFLWMDGHGPYVWACYGLTFAALVFLALEPKLQRSRFIKHQKALAKRQAHQAVG